MAGTPRDKARPEPGQGPEDGTEIPGDPTGNRAALRADHATLGPGLNDVPQDLPVDDRDAVESWAAQEPVAGLEDAASRPSPPGAPTARRGTWRYSEGDLVLRVTYPDGSTETPSALVARSSHRLAVVLWSIAGSFCALMAWAASQPPPGGDAVAAWMLAVVASTLLGVAWRFASLRLRATEQGIVITYFISRRRIPWPSLLDVTLDTVTHAETQERLYEQLVLHTKRSGTRRAGDLVVVEVDEVTGDAHDHTGSLHFVRTVLLAMRDRYSEPPRPQSDIQDS